MTGKLAKPDDIKIQLEFLAEEIREFTNLLNQFESHEESLLYGYDVEEHYDRRYSAISGMTRFNKPISDSTLLLVLSVLQSLERGPRNEKDIKDQAVAVFTAQGKKVSNRSTFSGTILDVASVCSMLQVLGVIEAVSEDVPAPTSSDSAAEGQSTGNNGVYTRLIDRCQQLLTEFRAAQHAKLEVKVQDSVSQVEAMTENTSLVLTEAEEREDGVSAGNLDTLSDHHPSSEDDDSSGDEDGDSEGSEHDDVDMAAEDSKQDNDRYNDDSDVVIMPPDDDGGEHVANESADSAAQADTAMDVDEGEDEANPALVADAAAESILVPTTTIGQSEPSNDNSSHIAATQPRKTKASSSKDKSVLRTWRIRRLSPLAQQRDQMFELLMDPGRVIGDWALACYKEQRVSEVEEKLLRSVLWKCHHTNSNSSNSNGVIPNNNNHNHGHGTDGDGNMAHYYRLLKPHTGYLGMYGSGAEGIEGGFGAVNSANSLAHGDNSIGQGDAQPTNSSSISKVRSQPSNASASTAKDLYDSSVAITATHLLDKIKASKRMRGGALQTSQHQTFSYYLFNGNSLNAFRNTVKRTNANYWQPGNAQMASKSHSAGGGSVCVVDFLRAHHLNNSLDRYTTSDAEGGTSNAAAQGTKHSAYNSLVASLHTVALFGAAPSLSQCLLKHYSMAQSLLHYDYTPGYDTRSSAANSSSNAMFMGMTLPDLALTSLEMPWVPNFAKDFAIVTEASHDSSTESGGHSAGSELFVDGLSKRLLSHAESAADIANPHSSSKRQKTAHSQEEKGDVVYCESLKRKVISEVNAPSFREISDSRMRREDSHSSDEDTSDESYLAKHDAVLNNMKEKWNLLHALKQQDHRRRDSSLGNHSAQSTGNLSKQRKHSLSFGGSSNHDVSAAIPLVHHPSASSLLYSASEPSVMYTSAPQSSHSRSMTEEDATMEEEDFTMGNLPGVDDSGTMPTITPKKRGRPPKHHPKKK